MRQNHETAQKTLLGAPKQSHVMAALTAAEHRKQGDHQHLMQVMARCIAAAGIANALEYIRKFFHHGAPANQRMRLFRIRSESSEIHFFKSDSPERAGGGIE